ncbi:homoserine O-acetyltransferase [Citricoccus sp. GCM10030269]|uniref:homoserine O-acetyltransferase MetX n=1 Tax=Citricoccus sp. GCM10030269 TaxID=3273388 RepID=UPI00361BDBFB
MTTITPQRSGTGLADGGLHSLRTGAFDFESGGHLPAVDIAYETWGTLNAQKSNAVLLLHALTGSTHVASSSEIPEDGWWEGMVGPGRPIDTDTWFVVAPNILGGCYGTTGPSSLDPDGTPWGSRFPFTTIRDSVRAEVRLADALGIERWQAVIGGSMGGARALEWAATYPERVAGMGVIACGAHSTAEQIAFAQAQIQAITLDPNFRGGDYYGGPTPDGGLGIARKIAHITYRSEPDIGERFGRKPQLDEDPFGDPVCRHGRYQIESYLDYQAAKLAKRFDANSYRVLTEALMSHDVSRGRGAESSVLAEIEAAPFIAAVESDRLYFPVQSENLARQLPGEVTVHMIDSAVGHDGFLTDMEQLGEALRRDLGL